MPMHASTAAPDYTVKEFAATTHQSVQNVYRLIRDGSIPAYRIGNAIRIRREDVEVIRRPANRLNPELAAEVKRAVDSWPPLTPDQREAIVAIFAAAGGAGV